MLTYIVEFWNRRRLWLQRVDDAKQWQAYERAQAAEHSSAVTRLLEQAVDRRDAAARRLDDQAREEPVFGAIGPVRPEEAKLTDDEDDL